MRGRTRAIEAYMKKAKKFLAGLTHEHDGIECFPSAFQDMTHIYIDRRSKPYRSYLDIGDDGAVDAVYYFGNGPAQSHIVLDRRQNGRRTIMPNDEVHLRGIGKALDLQREYSEVKSAFQEQVAKKRAE